MNDFIMMTNSQLSAIRTSEKNRIQCKLAYVPPYEQFNEISIEKTMERLQNIFLK